MSNKYDFDSDFEKLAKRFNRWAENHPNSMVLFYANGGFIQLMAILVTVQNGINPINIGALAMFWLFFGLNIALAYHYYKKGKGVTK